eukprot:gnl/TRDRNA2_/TRDRNA2_179499_c0_seq1.p1 gnl/TRDRNA2_/TRDRNA2_179499_c0~~gnl/TRDRNA2_/TRDRNA2_179499_c0_seq1.p1  ORF type:complete len:233 (+),score=28.87 gnl/TRDRNA2_/TRDRNA2_179499_c0_seq1:80-778(+)
MQSPYGQKADLPAGDPDTQWKWHEVYRDSQKNMYRTSYSDMIHGREVHVQSDFPAGYGGHIQSLRCDVLHRNTAFDRHKALTRADPHRDSFISFKEQRDGLPTYCKNPGGARKVPTYKVHPRDPNDPNNAAFVRAPWGCTRPIRKLPTYRTAPASMLRSTSMPSLGMAGSAVAQGGRTGGFEDYGGASAPQSPQFNMSPGGQLNNFVENANTAANQGYMPTEAEILREQMQS